LAIIESLSCFLSLFIGVVGNNPARAIDSARGQSMSPRHCSLGFPLFFRRTEVRDFLSKSATFFSSP
jgi:hypothetical protein